MLKRQTDGPGLAPDAKLLLSVEEAAQVLSLGRNTAYDLVLGGQIASIKIGRLRRVPLEALRAFVVRQLEQADRG